MSTSKPIAIIFGAGPGTGAGIARAFASTHSLALLARSTSTLEATIRSLPSSAIAKPFVADAADAKSIASAFEEIRKEWPESVLDFAAYNTGGGYKPGNFLDMDIGILKQNLDVMVLGAFSFSQIFLKEALKNKGSHKATLIFSGATGSIRGGSNFSVMSPAKFGLRSLSQCLAREFGPKGIHVAHSIIDGLIDTPAIKGWMGEAKAENARLSPDSIGKAYKYLYDQDPSCWTQELDLRPAAETF